MATEVAVLRSPADTAHGYEFGIDGFATRQQAAEHLAVSVATVDRLVDAGLLRKAKRGAAKQAGVRICKRSLKEYTASLEC